MTYQREETVRFAHCDPAGIVFFPQYLVMLNNLVEEWFDRGLRIPYAGLVSERRLGLPTVRLEVDFTAVSRLGDLLTQKLSLRHLGRTSMHLHTEFYGRGELRMRVKHVVVCTSLEDHRPRLLPDDVRAALQPVVEAAP
ncbi:MAG: thioesterase family protein [Pseudomonadota bacterium]